MAIGISNKGRKCGKKKDGWYLTGGAMSKDGTLLPLVWAPGSMVLGTDTNLPWKPQEKSLIYMDGEMSFDFASLEWVEYRVGMLSRSNGHYKGSGKPQLQRLSQSTNQPLCLLKHMGASFYTPATKAIELVQQGPSERFRQSVVTSLAPYLKHGALKLFYTSSQVPVFVTEADRDAFMDYLFLEQPDNDHLFLQVAWSMDYDEAKTLYEPAWEMADWRWRMIRTASGLQFPNNGSQHWWVKLLSYVHRHHNMEIEGLVEREMVCMGTQITDAQRVVSYEAAQQATGHSTVVPEELDDAQFAPEAALKGGIKVVVLPPEGEEEWN